MKGSVQKEKLKATMAKAHDFLTLQKGSRKPTQKEKEAKLSQARYDEDRKFYMKFFMEIDGHVQRQEKFKADMAAEHYTTPREATDILSGAYKCEQAAKSALTSIKEKDFQKSTVKLPQSFDENAFAITSTAVELPRIYMR